MNHQITRLFAVVVLLFALLVAFTSRWTVFEAESLEDNRANRRPLLEEQRIPRGLILASDGSRLAVSRKLGSGERARYVRDYPQGQLFSHAVGYSFITQGRAGTERYRNDELSGNEDEFESIFDEIRGATREGFDLRTALDPRAQRIAIEALAGRPGSIVALEPSTGRVRVMASAPDYDPNEIPGRLRELSRQQGSPLVNRATQSQYPPGSTFKVVTASAALDSGRYNPSSVVSGKSPKTIGGVPLSNCCGEGTGDFGALSLTEALTNSVNTVWAEVGEKLGKDTMYRYMDRFGLNDRPPLDFPGDELARSGVYSKGKLLDEGDAIDIGRVAIGQERLLVTPLQMATVVATVANGGERMKPRLGDRVVAPDGRVKDRIEPDGAARVMKPGTADAITRMMQSVVDGGTATAAKIPGVAVAGKTGTAEVERGRTNQAWFIGFAPANDPRIAIAVTIERTQGQGGTVAAPLAKRVMEELLRG
jgi:peptidoglycan glycosyltransferase